jgi:hypothetical protein
MTPRKPRSGSRSTKVCENVIDHADTQLGGFGAAQGWPKSNREFEVAVVDLGVGIRASLAKNSAYSAIADDKTAIATALLPHVTSTPERNAGNGLFVTQMLLAINGGHLLVRSGRGCVMRGAMNVERDTELVLPGTVVSLRARMDRPLDIATVYARLDEIDQRRAGSQDEPFNADH